MVRLGSKFGAEKGNKKTRQEEIRGKEGREIRDGETAEAISGEAPAGEEEAAPPTMAPTITGEAPVALAAADGVEETATGMDIMEREKVMERINQNPAHGQEQWSVARRGRGPLPRTPNRLPSGS